MSFDSVDKPTRLKSYVDEGAIPVKYRIGLYILLVAKVALCNTINGCKVDLSVILSFLLV